MIEIIEIEKITVKNRMRRDLGDIKPLMESMKHHGLFNPIVVTREGDLVAGQRRYEAARRLGWTAIQCRIIDNRDKVSMLEIEIEENTARKDFNSDEMADALLRLDKLRNPGWFDRLKRAIRRFFRRVDGFFREIFRRRS